MTVVMNVIMHKPMAEMMSALLYLYELKGKYLVRYFLQ